MSDNTKKDEQVFLFRYVDVKLESGYAGTPIVSVRLNRYPVIKETPEGWWIYRNWWFRTGKRWVSKTARGAWAKDTEEKALTGYIARKARQISILEWQLEHAQEAWKIAREMRDKDKSDVDFQELARQEHAAMIGGAYEPY